MVLVENTKVCMGEQFMALGLVSRLFSYRIKLLLEKIMSFSYVRASSEELAIGASCRSLTNTVSDFLLFTSKHRLMGVYRTF